MAITLRSDYSDQELFIIEQALIREGSHRLSNEVRRELMRRQVAKEGENKLKDEILDLKAEVRKLRVENQGLSNTNWELRNKVSWIERQNIGMIRSRDHDHVWGDIWWPSLPNVNPRRYCKIDGCKKWLPMPLATDWEDEPCQRSKTGHDPY